ncbi:MAG: DUF3267 domain-containing protein [Tractidigestivibacter sp.]|jgi:hypothetical protein|uniref:DUF3267 domain-containing protein n=1 Tax=Tractidigestivibacter sp. TaxID=2847320 RepID=UPI003D8C2EF7
MRKIADINVLEDKAFQKRLTRLSVVLFCVALAVSAAICTLMGMGEGGLGVLGSVLLFVALLIVPLPVHELVHALFFKLLCPSCHIHFGWKDAFLYTATDGAVLTRPRETVVLLAPAVLVTIATFSVGAAAGSPIAACVGAASHLGGCAGDILMAREAWKEPDCAYVKDSDTGIVLLAADEKD